MARGESQMQDMRRTLAEHTDAIAQVRADVGVLHGDNVFVKQRLDDIKDSLNTLAAREAAQPQKPGLQTLLTMGVSVLIIFSFLIGGLQYFIASQVRSENVLLEYRMAHVESGMAWTPTLVTVPGRQAQIGR